MRQDPGRPASRTPRKAAPPAKGFWQELQESVGARWGPTLRVDGRAAPKSDALWFVVTVVGATGLPPGDETVARYCEVEIKGKPSANARTEEVDGTADPSWESTLVLLGEAGDALDFAIWDDNMLGRASLSARVALRGFDGELALEDTIDSEAGGAFLRVNVASSRQRPSSPSALGHADQTLPCRPPGGQRRQPGSPRQRGGQRRRPSSAPAGGRAASADRTCWRHRLPGEAAGRMAVTESESSPHSSESVGHHYLRLCKELDLAAIEYASPKPGPRAAHRETAGRVRSELSEFLRTGLLTEGGTQIGMRQPWRGLAARHSAQALHRRARPPADDRPAPKSPKGPKCAEDPTGTLRFGGPSCAATGGLSEVMVQALWKKPNAAEMGFAQARSKGDPVYGKFLRRGEHQERPCFSRKGDDFFLYCFRKATWCISQKLGDPPSKALATSRCASELPPLDEPTLKRGQSEKGEPAWTVNQAYAIGPVRVVGDASSRIGEQAFRSSLRIGTTGLWTHHAEGKNPSRFVRPPKENFRPTPVRPPSAERPTYAQDTKASMASKVTRQASAPLRYRTPTPTNQFYGPERLYYFPADVRRAAEEEAERTWAPSGAWG
mmetsp:Transcript_62433/g.179570  ORF Transcript_62433/g.179570 Transcript_62433/m.179570 type:complete len:609 (+) Transcript_62433:79-1905(+)